MTRVRLLRHRRPQTLVLDAVFFVWLSYVAVSGNLLPDALVALIQHQPPASVVSEPVDAPADLPVLLMEEPPEAAGSPAGLLAHTWA